MPLMKYYIGLDAHSTTSTFAVVDENGQCILRETVKTSEQSLVSVIKKINGERHMTFEESSISQWLYLQLKDSVDKLLICNPTYVAKKQGAKTDFRDALHLAQELRTNHLQAVFHDTSHWMEIRTTVSGYLDIVEEIVRFKNRLKSVFRAEAIQTNENSFYLNKERVKEIKNKAAQFVAEKLFDQIEFLEKEKDKYKEVFEKNRKKYRPIRNLMTIPGISIIRANIIAAIVCQPARFENKHKFWGYCMLVRHIQISGGKIYGNKRFFGRRELRNVFIGAAENALRIDGELRDRYEALRAKGVEHKDAKLNLARQVASIALCLLKNNDKYNENYGEYLKERKKTRKEFFEQTL
jgi:transposase